MEDDWCDIAPNYSAARVNYSGVTGAQTGYCESMLNEFWTGAKPYFSMVYSEDVFRVRTRSTWKSKHLFYIFLMYIHSYPTKDRFSIPQYSFIYLSYFNDALCLKVCRCPQNTTCIRNEVQRFLQNCYAASEELEWGY